MVKSYTKANYHEHDDDWELQVQAHPLALFANVKCCFTCENCDNECGSCNVLGESTGMIEYIQFGFCCDKYKIKKDLYVLNMPQEWYDYFNNNKNALQDNAIGSYELVDAKEETNKDKDN